MVDIEMSGLGSLSLHWDGARTKLKRFRQNDQQAHQWECCFPGRRLTFHSAVRVSSSNRQRQPLVEMRGWVRGLVSPVARSYQRCVGSPTSCPSVKPPHTLVQSPSL